MVVICCKIKYSIFTWDQLYLGLVNYDILIDISYFIMEAHIHHIRKQKTS